MNVFILGYGVTIMGVDVYGEAIVSASEDSASNREKGEGWKTRAAAIEVLVMATVRWGVATEQWEAVCRCRLRVVQGELRYRWGRRLWVCWRLRRCERGGIDVVRMNEVDIQS